jgi:hypothetical protein
LITTKCHREKFFTKNVTEKNVTEKCQRGDGDDKKLTFLDRVGLANRGIGDSLNSGHAGISSRGFDITPIDDGRRLYSLGSSVALSPLPR